MRISDWSSDVCSSDLLCLKSTQRIASSNTCLRTCCVSAEHSTYLYAPSSDANPCPSSGVTGAARFCARRLLVSGSSRKSSFVPTRMNGAPGAWCCKVADDRDKLHHFCESMKQK